MFRQLLHRPIAVTMTLIAIVTLGMLALSRIPISLMPDIDVPKIVVQLSLPGSSAQEVEQTAVTPLRQQLSQVSGLRSIESSSRTDAGLITLSFNPGSNMSLLFIEVNEKIDRAMGIMPKEMERPKVMKIGALDIPAFYIDVTGPDIRVLSRLVTHVISKRMEQLPEVAMVDYSGIVGTQISLQPDEARMASLGITLTDIEQAISNNHIVLEALSVRDGIYRYHIHFDAQIMTADDIRNLYLRHEGRLLQLKDICRVEEQEAPRKGMVSSDGKEAITMAVIKQSDARMSDLQQRMTTLISQLEQDYPELHFSIMRDQTQLLSYSISNLSWNLLLGVVMASVVLFFFIGGWRLPLMVVIAIPLSLILTLLCFWLLNISLNIISLSGLILGVGMMVDNAIIVTDNIGQQEKHDDRSVTDAVREVLMPMLSSVLTTCSVFIPLIFLSGTAGALFFDQAMGITIALFCSLAVAVIVIPVYYVQLCSKEKRKETKANRILERAYQQGMKLSFRHQRIMVAGIGLCMALIVVLFPFIRKERLPLLPHNDALVKIDWNKGIVVEENNRRVAETLQKAHPYLQATTTMMGTQDFMLSHTANLTGSEAICYVRGASPESCEKGVEVIRQYIATHYPEAKVEVTLAANIFDLIFSTDESDLQIRVHRKEGGRPSVAETRQLTDSLRRQFPRLGIQPVATETCLRYRADAERMAYYHISYQQLHARLSELLGAHSVFDITSAGERIPTVVTANDSEARTMLAQRVTNAEGVGIPLSYVIEEWMDEDYKILMAGNEGEYAVIDIAHLTDSEAREVMEAVKNLTQTMAVEATFSGSHFSSRTMIAELAVVMCVALLLLYFILSAQFESLVQPLIILTEVVVDVAFVLLVLLLCGESVNVMSMIGMVVMCGIIINDSILKVDTINRLYRRREATAGSRALLKAICEAGKRRLKPIVMTSLTTILAILPLLRRGDMGSALQFPLSLTLVIGMVGGTLVSLYLVPVLYHLLYRNRS